MVNGNNKKEKPTWKRKQQESEGTYQFNGFMLMTSGVQSTLSQEEIDWILKDLFQFIKEKKGLVDYLQCYECSDGKRKVWFIDQLNKEMLEGDGYTKAQKKEYNHFTMLLPSEY